MRGRARTVPVDGQLAAILTVAPGRMWGPLGLERRPTWYGKNEVARTSRRWDRPPTEVLRTPGQPPTGDHAHHTRRIYVKGDDGSGSDGVPVRKSVLCAPGRSGPQPFAPLTRSSSLPDGRSLCAWW